jgi:hypothetical protein
MSDLRRLPGRLSVRSMPSSTARRNASNLAAVIVAAFTGVSGPRFRHRIEAIVERFAEWTGKGGALRRSCCPYPPARHEAAHGAS